MCLLPLRHAWTNEHIEQPRFDDGLLVRIAHSADKLISFQRLGNQKSEVAFHSLERGRRIRRTHKAGLALDWNGIEENLGGHDADGQAELFYHFLLGRTEGRARWGQEGYKL